MAFLEVPSSSGASSMLSSIVPENEEEQALQTMFDEALQMSSQSSSQSKPVEPTKGFCVKFPATGGHKVFINICHTPDIPPPEDITEQELIKILESDDASSYKIPLSLGNPHHETDRSSNECTAYDVIVNSDFFARIQKSELLKTFVILLATQGVEDKYSEQLSRDDFLILKNKRYMGTMPVHYIQDRGTQKPCPLIDEIGGVDEPMQIDPPSSARRAAPKVTLSRVQEPGRFAEHLVVEAQIPGVTSLNDLTVDIASDRILIVRCGSPVDVYLPLKIDVAYARAKFDYKTSQLQIDVPILS